MNVVQADLDRATGRVPNLWGLVKDPEEFWGDLSTYGRRLLKELLEGTMELWRDEWIGLEPYEADSQRPSYRNGYYRRKRWTTTLGLLDQVRVPRCRQPGLTEHIFERLEAHDEALGESAVEMLPAGVQGGMESLYLHVPRQRCWFHKMSNVATRIRKKDQPKVLGGLRAVYSAPTRREAERTYVHWRREWKDRYPQAVACVERDLDLLLAFFQAPPAHRRMVRTTNPIERAFREVRRRTRSIGTLVNDASIERIIYGLVAYFNRKYVGRVRPTFNKKRAVA